MMVTLTGFADEISADLEEQMDLLSSEGISHIELRSVWQTNVMKLSDEQAAKIKERLDARGFHISSIGSPIGKYSVRDDFSPQLADLKRAIELARYFGAQYIRIFSYYIPEGEPAANYRDEVLSRMSRLAQMAEQHNVILLLENESGVYGDTDDRYLDLLQSCQSPNLRSAFDPGNFVMNRVRPVTDAYPKVESFIEYIHVKDANREARQFVPAGVGDGQLKELLLALKKRRFSGFLSVEPHLQKYMPDSTNPERFRTAIHAIKKLLDETGLEWN